MSSFIRQGTSDLDRLHLRRRARALWTFMRGTGGFGVFWIVAPSCIARRRNTQKLSAVKQYNEIMERIFQLSRLVDKLSNKEFMQWLNHYDKNVLSTLLVNGLFYELEHSQSLSQWNQDSAPKLRQMHENVGDIICKRKKDIAEEDVKPLNVDTLPNEMIAHISTFLKFSELLTFEKCNKSILIGIRSLNALDQMNTDISRKCVRSKSSANHQFYRFKNVKHISFGSMFLLDSIFDIKYGDYDDRWRGIITTEYKFNHITPNWNNIESLTFKSRWGDMLCIQSAVSNMGTKYMPRLGRFDWFDYRKDIFVNGWADFGFEIFVESMHRINKKSNINYFILTLRSLQGSVVEIADFINIKSQTVTPMEVIDMV
eukprot:197308_1